MIIRFIIEEYSEIERCTSIWQERYRLQTKDVRVYEYFDTMVIGGNEFDLYIEHKHDKHIAISGDRVYKTKGEIIPVNEHQWLIPDKDDEWQLATRESDEIFEEQDEKNDYNGFNPEDIDDSEVNMSEHMLRGGEDR